LTETKQLESKNTTLCMSGKSSYCGHDLSPITMEMICLRLRSLDQGRNAGVMSNNKQRNKSISGFLEALPTLHWSLKLWCQLFNLWCFFRKNS